MPEPIHQSLEINFPKACPFPEMTWKAWIAIRNIYLDKCRIEQSVNKMGLDIGQKDGEGRINLDLILGIDRLIEVTRQAMVNNGRLANKTILQTYREGQLASISHQFAQIANHAEDLATRKELNDDDKAGFIRSLRNTRDIRWDVGIDTNTAIAAYQSDIYPIGLKAFVVGSQALLTADQKQVITDLLINIKNGYDPDGDIPERDHLDVLIDIWAGDHKSTAKDIFNDDSPLSVYSTNRLELVTNKKEQGMISTHLVDVGFTGQTNIDLDQMEEYLDRVIDKMVEDRRGQIWLENEKMLETASDTKSRLLPVTPFKIDHHTLKGTVNRLFGKGTIVPYIKQLSNLNQELRSLNLGIGGGEFGHFTV
jgi:hypothetical protein